MPKQEEDYDHISSRMTRLRHLASLGYVIQKTALRRSGKTGRTLVIS